MARSLRPLWFAALLLGTASTQESVSSPSTPVPPVEARSGTAPGVPTRAVVGSGTLVGREGGGVRLFQGVPYAAPPTGERRWRAPQPALNWTGERDASRPGPACPQTRPRQLGGGLTGSEDCLYLNVAAPSGAARAPVMVWIHGGSFRTGAGSDYDPRVLAREEGVVVVTVNYRLGALGFLAAPTLLEGRTVGNYGLLDQQAALRWVRGNAAAFGGDPGNVTVFGESAGAMSICAQLASPLSGGLFDRAILQSGPCTSDSIVAPLPDALRRGQAYTRALGCAEGDAACLRAVPVARVLGTPVSGGGTPGAVDPPPVYGDAVVPRAPREVFAAGNIPRVPLLIGSNLDEGTLFVAPLGREGGDLPVWQYWALVAALERQRAPRVLAQYAARAYPTASLAAAALVTDGVFACPTNDIARSLARVSPVYAYEFRDRAAPTELRPTRGIPSYGAYHASELISVFGTPLRGLADPAQFTPAQAVLARTMRGYWANFARSGNPNRPGLPEWRPLNPERNNLLALAPGRVEEGTTFRAEHRCDLWSR